MIPVGKHSGESTEAAPGIGYLIRLSLGMLLTLIAWGALVWLAIHFGGLARSGQGLAWAFMTLAGIGAAACLFLGIMLATHLIVAAGTMRHATAIAPEERQPATKYEGRRVAK